MLRCSLAGRHALTAQSARMASDRFRHQRWGPKPSALKPGPTSLTMFMVRPTRSHSTAYSGSSPSPLLTCGSRVQRWRVSRHCCSSGGPTAWPDSFLEERLPTHPSSSRYQHVSRVRPREHCTTQRASIDCMSIEARCQAHLQVVADAHRLDARLRISEEQQSQFCHAALVAMGSNAS